MKRLFRKAVGPLLLVLLVSQLAACANSNSVAEERAVQAAESQGDIVIGAAWPFASSAELMEEGLDMAVAEINAAGGLLGRQIHLQKEDDHSSVTEGLAIAEKLSNQLEMVAVIGHYNSSISVPTAAIYDQAGMLMLTPGSTAPKLTELGYQHVFRSIPNDNRIAAEMARYARNQGYEQVAIFYTDDEYGRGLANAFEDSAAASGVQIIDRISHYSDYRDLQRTAEKWKTLDCDAIFMADVMPAAAHTISLLRQAGMEVPIIGGDGLDSRQLIEIAEEAAEGTVVATIFNPNDPDDKVQSFLQRFEQKYGVPANLWAAQGYDSVYLLAEAIRQANSLVPAEIIQALRGLAGWEGVTGEHSFDSQGDIVGKPVVKKIVQQGRFEYLDD